MAKPDDRGIIFCGRRYAVRLRGGRRLPAIFGTREDARNARDAHEAWPHREPIQVIESLRDSED